MPNWLLLVDALTGDPRNDWERFAGPRRLARRRDLAVSWTIRPPLGVAVKLS